MTPAARGLVLRADITEPANWRAAQHLDAWLESHGLVGIAGVDTRRTDAAHPRRRCAQRRALPAPDGVRSRRRCVAEARHWPGLEGMDLAREVSCRQTYQLGRDGLGAGPGLWPAGSAALHVVAVDYGAKRNILRCLASAGCRVTVVPATATAEDILAPRARRGLPLERPRRSRRRPARTRCRRSATSSRRACRCSASASATRCWPSRLGGRPRKMPIGHRGANHPVKDLDDRQGRDHQPEPRLRAWSRRACRRASRSPTSRCSTAATRACAVEDKPVFSVQYHPEASPGPQDSHYLFERFVDLMEMAR